MRDTLVRQFNAFGRVVVVVVDADGPALLDDAGLGSDVAVAHDEHCLLVSDVDVAVASD